MAIHVTWSTCPDPQLADVICHSGLSRDIGICSEQVPRSSSSPLVFIFLRTWPFIAFTTIWYILCLHKLQESWDFSLTFSTAPWGLPTIPGRNISPEPSPTLCTGHTDMNMARCLYRKRIHYPGAGLPEPGANEPLCLQAAAIWPTARLDFHLPTLETQHHVCVLLDWSCFTFRA